MHGRAILRAVLTGFAGVAPRSATQNLIELLSMIASKYPSETREWMNEILFTVCVDVSASGMLCLPGRIVPGGFRAIQGHSGG